MPLHPPRFRPGGLMLLVAVLAAELGTLPTNLVAGMVAFTMACALMASVSGPLRRHDWAAFAVSHAILISFLLPAIERSSPSTGRRPAKATKAAPR